MDHARDVLALTHSWPLFEQEHRFDLGHVINCVVTDLLEPRLTGDLGVHHAGCWECDLSNDKLTWSGGVYDLFGLPRGVQVTREEAISFYSEESRAAMERLRSYAIRHRRGFTLDAAIRPATGGARTMRLISAPVCEGDRVVRLHGLKLLL